MEYCKFKRGKRKNLLEKRRNKNYKLNDLNIQKLLNYKRSINRFEELIDKSIRKLCENPLKEIMEFIENSWLETKNFRDVPTGIVRCGNFEGFRLEDFISAKYGKRLIKLGHPVPSIYLVVQMIRKTPEGKCIILNQIESISGSFIDDLISLIADDNWKIPLAIIITISGDLSAIYSRCSYQSYSRMSIKQFQFPSPITFLNAVTDLIAFDPGVEFKVDGKLLEIVRRRFLDVSFSIDEVKKIVSFMMLQYYIESETGEHNLDDNSLIILNQYKAFLELLFDFSCGFSSQMKDIYDLHQAIQTNNFFSSKNDIFSSWKGFWLTWDAVEMIDALEKIIPLVRNLNKPLADAMTKLKDDLEHLEVRIEKARSVLCQVQAKPATTPLKMTHDEMQQRMKEKILQKKKLDVLSGDRQTFLKLITQAFSSFLLPYDKIPALKDSLLHGASDLCRLCIPSVHESLEYVIGRRHKECVSTAVILIYYSLQSCLSQLDICVAYQTLQTFWTSGKSVPLKGWFKEFIKEISQIPNTDNLYRFYRSVIELEMLGIIKAISSNNLSAVSLLHVPSSFEIFIEILVLFIFRFYRIYRYMSEESKDGGEDLNDVDDNNIGDENRNENGFNLHDNRANIIGDNGDENCQLADSSGSEPSTLSDIQNGLISINSESNSSCNDEEDRLSQKSQSFGSNLSDKIREKTFDVQLYSSEIQGKAISNLVIYGIAMLIIPVSVLLSLRSFFHGFLDFEYLTANIWAAGISVFVIYLILFCLMRTALNEEKELEKMKKKDQ
ncbi:unnamed protein product [Dracunculus medinensis]|uniref:ORC3_N domain-containing protein n=1 Tax=Dracunculus medinensis TaxID=318479 RepID=A0A158Q5T1_DRAME|nr:unnamed protein product [Dracunculus medinensis]